MCIDVKWWYKNRKGHSIVRGLTLPPTAGLWWVIAKPRKWNALLQSHRFTRKVTPVAQDFHMEAENICLQSSLWAGKDNQVPMKTLYWIAWSGGWPPFPGITPGQSFMWHQEKCIRVVPTLGEVSFWGTASTTPLWKVVDLTGGKKQRWVQ